MDGKLEVKGLEIDGSPRGRVLSPEPDLGLPRISRIHDVWVSPDDRTLVVGGLHGFETGLHSLDVDESEDEVGLLARIAFTPEAARQRVEASERILELSVGIEWSAEVRLQNVLVGRRVVDRGVSILNVPRSEQPPPLHALVIAKLESELAAKPRPAERRRIRQTIKAIRHNPFKAVAWAEKQEAATEQKNWLARARLPFVARVDTRPVAFGSCLDDVGVEGQPVDDGRHESGSGMIEPHSLKGRLLPQPMAARSSRSVMTWKSSSAPRARTTG